MVGFIEAYRLILKIIIYYLNDLILEELTTMSNKKVIEKIKELAPIEVNVAVQNQYDYLMYALYVLANRSIASMYGFKPVHMRLLYCIWNDVKAIDVTKKCASIVGRVLELYHPHGDSAAYKALAPMANWYDCYIPLIRKQGNFGNYQGDKPAHYRYTEAALSEFAKECIIGELEESKQVVDWEKNYSESVMQPVYLPIKVPILLINGTSGGIGVGIKQDISSHNITEVIDATLRLIENPNAQVVLKPDLCMPCEIIDNNWKAISNKGNGTYTVRAIIEEGEYDHHPALFIKSLPFEVRLATVEKDIDALVKTDLPQIIDIKEDCKPDKMNCIIIFKNGTDLNYAKQIIYKKTDLQKTMRINFQVYDPINKELIRMSYKSYLQFFIEFRKEVKYRLYSSLYQDRMTKIHKYDMFLQMMADKRIDDIISFVRHNKKFNNNEMIEQLIKKFNMTDLQASFIVHNELAAFSPVHYKEYMDKINKYKADSEFYYNRIINDDLILQDIYDELVKIKEKYGCPRRCRIISTNEAFDIPEGEFKIVITENNYVRKIPVNDNIGSFRNDKPKFSVVIDNRSNLIVFDTKGRVYRLPVSKITMFDKRSNGVDIRLILKNLTSDIASVIPENVISEYSKKINRKYYITCLSVKGYIKKLDLEDFLQVPVSGFIFMKLDPDDFICQTSIISDKSDVIVYSKYKALRFSMKEVPLLKRITRGNIGMKAESVDGMSIIKTTSTDIVIITDNGYINRIGVNALDRAKRAQAGSRVIKLHKGDSIKYIFGVNIKDSIEVDSSNQDKSGVYAVAEIPEGSSISAGTKMISSREVIMDAHVIPG